MLMDVDIAAQILFKTVWQQAALRRMDKLMSDQLILILK